MASWRETNQEQAEDDGKHRGDEENGRGPRGEGSLTETPGRKGTEHAKRLGQCEPQGGTEAFATRTGVGHGLKRPEAAARLVSRTGTVRVEAHDAFLAQTKRCATQVWRRRDGTGCSDT
ncbi:hypothetical protein ERJ75_000266200 [Trypanosoma vivax]|nr:hypothetical protein ERJ75_000266200 [Trypanosoma vivax]